VKGDVHGSVEAFISAVKDIGNDQAKVKIVYSAVGDIRDFDIKVAKVTKGDVLYCVTSDWLQLNLHLQPSS
jgi:translation initiation factor IF-2